MTDADLLISAGGVLNFASDQAPGPGRATHVAISGRRIIATGGPELAALNPAARRLDFGPRAAILPGLVDTHTHPVWGSESRGGGVDLTGVTSLEQLRRRIAPAAAGGAWVSGFALDPAVFGPEPCGRVLETWFAGVPIVLMTSDAHAVVASPAAIEAAGITGDETFADASRVVCDASGPTGWLVELQAMDLVFSALPAAPLEMQAEYLLDALTQFACAGLTEVHALDFHDPSNELYELLETQGELPVRVRCFPLVPADSGPDVWAEIAALAACGGRRWHVAGVKLMLDGTADNGTAWFEHPDCHGENREALWRDPEAYRAAVAFFTAAGLPTVTHAIGDRAVEYVLDVIESTGHTAAAPHRIEHIESIPDRLVSRFASLGVVAGLQPTHATRFTRATGDDPWSQRLGAERAAQGWRVRDLLDAGTTVTLSSDWPIGEADPRISLAEAQLRRPLADADQEPVQPTQRIGAREAYRAMTVAAAEASGEPSERGVVAAGYAADLTVLSADPTMLAPEAQAGVRVLATVVDGEPLLVTR
ncbi:amidohydrolase [Leucobacter sp. HY1910]